MDFDRFFKACPFAAFEREFETFYKVEFEPEELREWLASKQYIQIYTLAFGTPAQKLFGRKGAGVGLRRIKTVVQLQDASLIYYPKDGVPEEKYLWARVFAEIDSSRIVAERLENGRLSMANIFHLVKTIFENEERIKLETLVKRIGYGSESRDVHRFVREKFDEHIRPLIPKFIDGPRNPKPSSIYTLTKFAVKSYKHYLAHKKQFLRAKENRILIAYPFGR